MHQIIYKAIEDILGRQIVKGRVLEIGAIPNERSILCSSKLSKVEEKIGINLKGPYQYKDFKIFQGNANDMNIFKTESFDCVLCNAMLEHDPYFWKTIAEIHRVLKKGGLAVIGTPGFTVTKQESRLRSLLRKRFIRRIKFPDFINDLSFCFRIHNEPGDFYRFSEQTYKEVFFEGFENVSIETHMFPPRVLGSGFKK